MAISNDLNSHLQRLKQAANQNRLVIFVGSGISVPSGLPTWNSLINQLRGELSGEFENDDNLKIAQLFKNARGFKEYIDSVRTYLLHEKASYNVLHDAIIDLDPVHIITTNYDNLIEQSLEGKQTYYHNVRQDADLPFSPHDRLLLKMHGDLGLGNIVLTEDDYLNYQRNFPVIEAFVRSIIATKTVLFIGFSFSDWNLKFIINNVSSLLGDNFQPMYLFNLNEFNIHQSNYYNKRRLITINYEPELHAFLSESDKLQLPLIESEQTKRTFIFLTALKSYVPEITFKGSIIDRTYLRLERYIKGINVIGYNQLNELLAIEGSEKTFLHNQTISTEDPEILDILEKLDYNRFFYKALVNSRLYNELCEFLRSNGVYFLKNLNTNRVYYLKRSLKLNTKEKHCTELLFELNIQLLLQKIASLRSRNKHEVSFNDLELPFIYYKVGQYYNSYLEFKILAEKAWRQKQYVVFYLAQHNMKRVGNLASYGYGDDDILDGETSTRLSAEIEKLDLEKALSFVRLEDKLIYEVLKRVNDYNFVLDEFPDIDQEIDKVEENFEYNRQGNYTSHNDASNVFFKGLTLMSFTLNNYIATEHFTEHKRIYKKVFRAIVKSHNTPENDEDLKVRKIEKISKRHLFFVLFLNDSKYFKQLFKDEETKLEFDDEAIKYLTLLITNFTSTPTHLSIPRSLQKISYTVVNNILFLLSRSADKLEGIGIEKLVEFLIKQKDLDFSDVYDGLESIVKRHYFPLELLNELLNKFIAGLIRQRNTQWGLMYLICAKLGESKSACVFDRRSVEVVFSIALNERSIFDSFILYLYQYFSPELKKEALNVIEENIHTDGQIKMKYIRLVILLKIPIKRDILRRFALKLLGALKQQGNLKTDYLLALSYLYHSSLISPKTKLSIKESFKKPYMKFLLTPDESEELNEFKLDWLIGLNGVQQELIKRNTFVREFLANYIRNDRQPRMDVVKYYFKTFV